MSVLILLNILIFFTMTVRWSLILAALGHKIPYLALIGFRLAGNAISYFTPGPQFGGEPIQVYLLHRMRYHQISRTVPLETATASVVIDRLMELLANFSVLFIGMFFMFKQRLSTVLFDLKAVWIAIILLLCPLLLLLAIFSGNRPFSQTLQRFSPKRLHNLIHNIQNSEREAEILFKQKPGILLQATLASALNWICMIGEFWLMYHFLGLTLSGVNVIIIMTAARFAFLTPIPGGLGALETSQVFILNLLGYSPSIGLSACIIIRIRDLLVGGLGLWLAGKFMTKTRH